MMTRALPFAVVLLSLGCQPVAATPATDETSGDETCPARADANRLTERLETCRAEQASQPTWPGQESFEALLEQLRVHLGSVSDGREVTSAEAQPIADAMWAFLDQLTFTAETEPLRTRAEEAAEALIRDRGRDQSAGAAQAAFEAITSVRATLHPPGIDPCAELEASAADAREHAAHVCGR